LRGEPLPQAAAPEPAAHLPMQRPAQPAMQPPAGPFGARLDARGGGQLPTRPPGRHRSPAERQPPQSVDLSANLHTVLDWLGRPES
jgi:hypothetical protein